MATGLLLNTNKASMAGPNSTLAGRSKSSPMVLILMVRHGPAGRKSGRVWTLSSKPCTPELDSNMPPAGLRQAPISAGRQVTARTALAPPRARCMP